ncbi:MAG TPA: polyhydroxyalkanoate synthesis repressor PhaR [Steroidobacteraceae bacterium]|jgi:polyhydroxyalkanoate synthesis repressor PhaR|nr:polyhydroxyalkanoate synthesis repressor PhaR [Steroidobacteraceae bacterium]
MSNERLIKKYANRRLYDSTESRHVTLEDIRKMIVSGAKVKVVDDKSGEDLTRAVLLQVIAEQDQYGTPVLSTELLEAIIRFYGNPVQEMLTKYMEQSVGTLVRQQETMRAEMSKALAGPMAPLAEFARQNMDQWSKIQASMMSAFAGAAPKPTEPEKEQPPKTK